MSSQKVLVVEDEEDLATTLGYNLQREGLESEWAKTGSEALEKLRRGTRFDLVLLDLMLPDISGNEVCKYIKGDAQLKDVPVVMLTAQAEEVDRVVGFELGADDFVPKPFSIRELMLRIKAVLRRVNTTPEGNESVVFGKIRVDVPGRRVWVDNAEVHLTALEFRLLQWLLQRRGRVQARDTLLEQVWGIDADITTRTVDTHVRRLRQKLGAAGHYIETLRGSGYCIREVVPE